MRFLWIEVCVENTVAQAPEDEARRRKSRQIRVRFGRESFRHEKRYLAAYELPSSATEEVRDLQQGSEAYWPTHEGDSPDRAKVEVRNLQETHEESKVSANAHEMARQSSSVPTLREEVRIQIEFKRAPVATRRFVYLSLRAVPEKLRHQSPLASP
jgi:hypothetical protein